MSKVFVLVALLGLIAAATAYDISKVRHAAPEGWIRLARADPRENVPFRIALRQRNLDILENLALDRSDPESPNYSQWMTPTEILDLIAPADAEIQPVVQWLTEGGARKVDASGRDVIVVEAPVSVVESLFKVHMYQYRHIASGRVQTRHAGSLQIPAEFESVIAFTSGITELVEPSHLKLHRKRDAQPKASDNAYIIPQVVRNLYSAPNTFFTSKTSSICVAEFQDDASYNPSDLTFFNQQMLENVKVAKNVGPFSPTNPDLESTLDVQYGFSIGLNKTAWFWTVTGWMYEFSTALFATKNPPLVVSMSWGWPEPLQCQVGTCTDSKSYVERVNTEFMKIGLLGVSLMASSGDQGAPGDGNADCSSTTTPLSTIFPGASPWVTSVGATQLNENGPTNNYNFKAPICQQYTCAAYTTEIVCSWPAALITSGGGFSNYVARPSWQQTQVAAYLNNPDANLPPSQYFSSQNRGFPDVAANGHNYLIGVQQSFEIVDGTSCSSPVFGGLISLMNDWRLDNNKKPLGFLNPLLYKAYATNPRTFTDITSGNNLCTESCCAQYGFTATAGWDATTGLGTPNFPALLAYVKTLP